MTQKSLVLHQYGKLPIVQDAPIPVLQKGQLLVQVEASTINPSDRLRINGSYFPVPLPATMGLEGAGRVIKAEGEQLQSWVGKRVSFIQNDSGSWGEYAVTTPFFAFPLTEDVPVYSAASGIVNPLTVIGMTSIYEDNPHKKGIIHTAAASALGRMLNKRCQRLNIPLLNIVRKQEHANLLKSQGAKHVIVTSGDWEKQYAQSIKNHGFNVFFDALGGGQITEKLILGMNANSAAYIYGILENKPLSFGSGLALSKGIKVSGYLVFNWFSKISAQKQQQIKNTYSDNLKNDLATTSYKYFNYSEIEKAIECSVSKATQGKITIFPDSKKISQKALVVYKYGDSPVLEQTLIPEAKEGQLLIKVEGSTINPSDRYRILGKYFPVALPATFGIQGVGRVVKVGSAQLKNLIGKRVSFLSQGKGSWAQYSITTPARSFVIDEDVPLHSAASGIVNPLTVVGMTQFYQLNPNKKGIIHTAAASALGRMLNKRCISLNIPLLNIVRREEHATLLRSEGAKHVIVTKGQWQKEYNQTITTHGFNVLFDALGGGQVTQKLIVGMKGGSIAYIYGALQGKPLSIANGLNLSGGIDITGYHLFQFFAIMTPERRKQINEAYSGWLKNDLSTTSYKILKLSEFNEALQLSVSKATQGKITLVP